MTSQGVRGGCDGAVQYALDEVEEIRGSGWVGDEGHTRVDWADGMHFCSCGSSYDRHDSLAAVVGVVAVQAEEE